MKSTKNGAMQKTKKSIGFRFVIALIISVLCLTPSTISMAAEDTDTTIYTSGDFEYSLAEDGTAVISAYTGTAAELTIPTELDGIAVSKIGDHSLEKNETIENLTVPSGVTVGICSFRYAAKLKKVTLEDGVTTIQQSAFSFCEALEEANLANSVTEIGSSAFQHCVNLQSITLPNQIETIGDFAFVGCEKFTSLEFPASLKEIGQNTFAYCNGLTSVEIPGTVKLISNGAFSYCDNLTSVTLNEGLEEVRIYAFSNCMKLMEISVPDSVTEIGRCSFGYYFDKGVWNDVKVPGFVLKGYSGSAAESYAKGCGVTFESLGDSILTPPTEPITTEPQPTEPTEPGSVTTVYFKNNAGFSNVYAYYWPKDGHGPISWPGVEMTLVKDDIYVVEVPAENNMIIFSNKGSSQTGDLAIPGNNYIYDGSSWSVYSDAPTEPTTEPTEPVTTEPITTEPITTEPVTTEPETEPTTEPKIYLLGDVNGDGVVNIKDATEVQLLAVESSQISDDLKKIADVNGDGIVNIVDATLIQKYAADIATDYNIGIAI